MSTLTRTLTVSAPRTESTSHLTVGRGLIDRAAEILDASSYSSIVVVCDEGATAWGVRLCAALKLPSSQILRLTGGEGCKTIESITDIWSFFATHKLDRRSLVLTCGGGALSDAVGFAASTYMRGVTFVNVPTTLLAQVDASVGGKTGINFAGLKNLIGTITQPAGVLIDIDTLATLPPREVISGFAEIIKHGLIADRAYFEHTTSRPCSTWSADELVDIVHRSCEIKRSVVESDETERGPRKTLNLGHTVGHALEAYAMHHQIPLSHGECVAIGVCAEAYLAMKLGRLAPADYVAVREGFTRAGLPTTMPCAFSINEVLDAMAHDKKNVGGSIRWCLLTGIGSAAYDIVAPEELVTESLGDIVARASSSGQMKPSP